MPGNQNHDTYYQRIGWWYWHTMNPSSKQFTTTELTAADRQNGYVSQAVYVDSRE